MNQTSSSPIRVLFLEGSPTEAKAIMDKLEKFPNMQFEVVWIDRVSKALEKLRQDSDFDVILADLDMPDVKNLEVIQKIRNQTLDLPLVVLINSVKETQLGIQALKAGAQDYLEKDSANSSLLGRAVRYSIESKSLADKIQEISEMKTVFISMISREFRTPLTVIQEAMHMLSKESGNIMNDEQKSHWQLVESNVNYLLRLVEDISDFQTLESGRKGLRVQVVNMYELVNETVQAMSSFASKKGLELKCQPAPQLPRVVCDRGKVAQVLTHFLNNGIQFTERGRILVTSEVRKNFLRVSVSDQGPGIKPEDQSKLFQMSGQISVGTKKTAGIGLGLFISKKIIEAHNGRVGIESAPGKGSTFYFELPFKLVEKEND